MIVCGHSLGKFLLPFVPLIKSYVNKIGLARGSCSYSYLSLRYYLRHNINIGGFSNGSLNENVLEGENIFLRSQAG
jgi:hypothetical protein